MCQTECINAGLEVFVLCSVQCETTQVQQQNKLVPWGSSVMSSGATWPSRSLVACTPELNPFASLLADCAKFIEDRLDCSLFH